MPGYYGAYGFHGPRFFPFFPFFGIGLALLFFFTIGGMLRMMAFRHWMQHARMEGHGPWGPGMHPWGGDPTGKKPADSAPTDPPTASETSKQ
jgi:hypothetical protein